MSTEVIFNEQNTDNVVQNIKIIPGAPKGITKWLIKNNLTSNARKAEQLLVWVTIFSLLLAIVVYVLATKDPGAKILPGSGQLPPPVSTH
jgi:hypothetical protein